MIAEFVKIWDRDKHFLEKAFSEKHPKDYAEIVKEVVTLLSFGSHDSYRRISAKRIHEIDDGDYQGNLLFVIGSNECGPSKYWYVYVSYGSCSGCDTLQAIQDNTSERPNAQQVADYMTLALHIVQGLKEMN